MAAPQHVFPTKDVLAKDYPSAHSIEVPASLAHRLSPSQLEALQRFAAGQCSCRHDVVALERSMEGGKSFEEALALLTKDKAANCKALPDAAAGAAGSGAPTPAKSAAAAAQTSAPASPSKA